MFHILNVPYQNKSEFGIGLAHVSIHSAIVRRETPTRRSNPRRLIRSTIAREPQPALAPRNPAALAPFRTCHIAYRHASARLCSI